MIRIDSEGMAKALLLAVYAESEILTDWLWMQVQEKAPPQVNREMIHKEVKLIGDRVLGTVSAGGIGALTTEWGSGSLADETNPAWNEYTQSRYYNPVRFPYGHPITGRPEGDYINLDGEVVHSDGNRAGYNLEAFLKPIEPQHWMREIVSLSRPYIWERMAQKVKNFPFHRFIHSDGR